MVGLTWSSVATDELFECCWDKQLVAKVTLIVFGSVNGDIVVVKVIRTSISNDEWLGTHYVLSLFDTTGPHDVSMVTMLVEQNLARHCDPDVSIVTIATCYHGTDNRFSYLLLHLRARSQLNK